jgi:transitional endoplasmic reticulum ATPase
MGDVSSEAMGKLVRILSVDPDGSRVHARGEDGNTTRFTVLKGVLPTRGDVVLLSDDHWEAAPQDAWLTPNNIATVRRLVPGEDVLIDDGLTIRPISNCRNVEIAVHNTVEYNEFDGIIRVVANEPIRSREYGVDRGDILKEYLVDTSAGGPSFSDFGGYPEVIERARELIETQFNRREYLDRIGARPVKGVLFTGPPGTGKTHLARIIAHESGAAFYLVSGPSIVSKWVGDTEDTLRKIFEAATASVPGKAIIFFDEIDSIAERRTGESHEASKRLVAQLLTLMDGFADDKGCSVVVVAATNRIESLDPALTRPGRFDWEIEFGIPTQVDRTQILRVGARHLRTSDDLPIETVAHLTKGWSAARLSAIWVEAALLAASEMRDRIAAEDMARAYERVARRPPRLAVEAQIL